MSVTQKISQTSAPAFNSALNVFSVPPTNVSVLRSYFREILPLNTVANDTPYLFRLFNDNLWADLSRVYLFLELGIEKPGKEPNTWVPIEKDDESVGPIQGIGQTFVQQLKITISNTEVYDSGTLYPYRAYITNELSYPASVKRSFLASAGYYSTNEHNKRKHDVADDGGFRARAELFKEGRTVQFMSRLDFDLGNQELYLINNIDVHFSIYRAKDAFLLERYKANDTTAYRLRAHTVKLYVKMIDVQPSLNLSVYSMLEKQPARYAVRKTELKNCFLTEGRTEIDHNVFTSIIPRRVTVALVANDAFNGAYGKSPFNFQPYGLRDISVHAGGYNYPAIPYNLNFTRSHCMKAYVDMYEALGAANNEHTCAITFEEFQKGWTFFIIPLTSTLDDSCGFELIRSGTTTLRLQFNSPIQRGGIQMIVLGEFDQLVMVDFNRRVICDTSLG